MRRGLPLHAQHHGDEPDSFAVRRGHRGHRRLDRVRRLWLLDQQGGARDTERLYFVEVRLLQAYGLRARADRYGEHHAGLREQPCTPSLRQGGEGLRSSLLLRGLHDIHRDMIQIHLFECLKWFFSFHLLQF